MSVENNLPYRAEYAKSGRASCKGCKNPIEKGTLRLAIMTTSRFHDGKDANWYHVPCFFAKTKPQSTGDFSHFESLRWDDQELIKDRIKPSGAGGQKDSKGVALETKEDYRVEYAKSKASTCVACEERIAKDVVRVGKMDYHSEKALKFGKFYRWHHVDCFTKIRGEIEVGFYDAGKNIPGYKDLEEDDKKELAAKLPAVSSGKRKLDDQGASGSKPSKQPKKDSTEEQIKTQNKQMYVYRDILKENMRKKDMELILSHNRQEIPVGDERMMDRIADIMTFGTLLPCKICKGQYVYRSGVGYQCMGYATEYAKCEDITDNPERVKFKLPTDYAETPGLEEYKSKIQRRVIPKHEAPVQAALNLAKKAGSSQARINSKPLKSFSIVIDASFSKSESEKMKAKIESFGGKVLSRISGKVAIIVAKEMKKGSKHMKSAKETGIPVVSEQFVTSLTEVKYKLAEAIQTHLICDWAGDIRGRLLTLNQEFEKPSEKKSLGLYEKEMKMQKLMLKDGAVVDPESGVADIGHILKTSNKGGFYTAVLNKVIIEEDKNSFYKLQLIESDKSPKTYWVFRAWGRIGTSIGGTKMDENLDQSEAIELFEKCFFDQTGNIWGQPFVKLPGRYISLDIDFSDKETINKIVPSTSKSSLQMTIQELICLIFDVDKMKQTMIEFEIDMEKMPLGKISRTQILKAYTALNDAMKLIEEKNKDKRALRDASNRFFTLIPHNFGIQALPMLNDDALIKTKVEMLESLLEIELAYELMKSDGGEDGSVDTYYKKLATDIDIVEGNSEEYKILQQYLENTHAATHDSYKLKIDQIFKIDRKGEKKRYKPFKKLHNRKLLWHGSRTTNYAGILSQGLKIAPPEAPVTGYMFGKGIYFADMVSKSANYCYTSPANTTGLLMLCEVALGDMHEMITAKESLTKAPKDTNSVKGLGTTIPDPNTTFTFPDGLEVPYGKPVATKVKNASLLYNEYIVYDVAQVNLKYLLKVNFKYKGGR